MKGRQTKKTERKAKNERKNKQHAVGETETMFEEKYAG